MAYGDFDLGTAIRDLRLSLGAARDLFADTPAVEPSSWLQTTLDLAPLARAMNTEKARSEMLIAPFFMELWRRYQGQCSYFSGMEFTVDAARGLRGYCDFILSSAPSPFVLVAPVAMITEAKNGDLPSGYGQCVAAMVAAQVFNAANGQPSPRVHGAVSIGDLWGFIELNGTVVTLDSQLYDLREAAKILGILVHLIS